MQFLIPLPPPALYSTDPDTAEAALLGYLIGFTIAAIAGVVAYIRHLLTRRKDRRAP